MKDYQPKGVSWVAETLRRSESLLAVNDAGTKVRRIPALVPPKDAFDRSVYAVRPARDARARARDKCGCREDACRATDPA